MLFYAYFSVSRKRNIRRSQNGTKSTGEVIFGRKATQGTWSARQGRYGLPTRVRVAPPLRASPPASWGPRSSSDIPPAPIYAYVPPNYQIRSQKPNSTAATFCTREIPSWGLFQSSAGGGIDHRGLLHHREGLSDEL